MSNAVPNNGLQEHQLADYINGIGLGLTAIGTFAAFSLGSVFGPVGVAIGGVIGAAGQVVQASSNLIARQIGDLPPSYPSITPDSGDYDPNPPGADDNDDNPDDDYMDHINGGGHGAGWRDPVGPGSAVPIVLDLSNSNSARHSRVSFWTIPCTRQRSHPTHDTHTKL